MTLQEAFFTALEKNEDKISIIKEFINKVTDDDINEDLKIDTKVCNIYVEYATKELINKGRKFSDRMNAYILIYHPKLFDLICQNKTMAEIINIKNILLHNVNSIYENTIKDDKYEVCSKMLSVDINKTRKNAFEYCYFLTWATFNKSWIGVDKKYVTENNTNDILWVNITYNLENLDSIVTYNNVADIKIPVLTEQMVKDTVKYTYIKPTHIAKSPVSMYDKDFKPITNFSTENVTVLIDYGNDHYTKCFFRDNMEVNSRFAKDVYDGKVKCNDNKTLLYNIVYRDLFKCLPPRCYCEKKNKSELNEHYNMMKRIALTCYLPDRKTCIHKILNHIDLPKIICKEEMDAFTVYMNYLMVADEYNDKIVVDHCCNYLYENYLEAKNLTDVA